MYDLLLILFLLVAICLIALILIQQGKGATMGASFGSGASGTLFGSTGAGNFMTRSTGVLAALFFIISLVLGNFATRGVHVNSDEWSNLGTTVTKQETSAPTPAKAPVATKAPAVSSVKSEPVSDAPSISKTEPSSKKVDESKGQPEKVKGEKAVSDTPKSAK